MNRILLCLSLTLLVFADLGENAVAQVKLTASDAAAFDHFGFSVAASGDTILVGSLSDDSDGPLTDMHIGSAYVFVRSGSTWIEQAKLTASDRALFDHFGWSVSLSSDTALVGASFDDDDSVNSGSAYVFVRSGSTWAEQAKLTASDAAGEDQRQCPATASE